MDVKEHSSGGPELERFQQFPKDYHDYVFRNGQLIGDFDNMYRYAERVPWEQDKICHHWYAEVGILMVRDYAPYEAILEIGCGLGYIAAKLKPFATGAIDAFDISPAAIEKAKRLHPGVDFYVDDIRMTTFRPKARYDLTVVRDLFWYVFPDMPTVVPNIDACVKLGGLLNISQSFPALERSFVGKAVIPSPEALLAYFPNYELITTALLRNHELVSDGPILHFLGRKTQ